MCTMTLKHSDHLSDDCKGIAVCADKLTTRLKTLFLIFVFVLHALIIHPTLSDLLRNPRH